MFLWQLIFLLILSFATIISPGLCPNDIFIMDRGYIVPCNAKAGGISIHRTDITKVLWRKLDIGIPQERDYQGWRKHLQQYYISPPTCHIFMQIRSFCAVNHGRHFLQSGTAINERSVVVKNVHHSTTCLSSTIQVTMA